MFCSCCCEDVAPGLHVLTRPQTKGLGNNKARLRSNVMEGSGRLRARQRFTARAQRIAKFVKKITNDLGTSHALFDFRVLYASWRLIGFEQPLLLVVVFEAKVRD